MPVPAAAPRAQGAKRAGEWPVLVCARVPWPGLTQSQPWQGTNPSPEALREISRALADDEQAVP